MFYWASQVSHVNSLSLEMPRPKGEWALCQILSTQGDYAYYSWFWNFVSVGLNCQMIHHLFPTVHPCHYPDISRRVLAMFERLGLPTPGWKNSQWDVVKMHVCHLRSMNEKNFNKKTN